VFHNAVDGVLMVSPYLPEEGIRQMKGYRVPVVLIGCRVDDPQMDFVDSDNVKASGEVVDHLARMGHRKIAIVTGEVEISRNASDRLLGFQEAMKERGLPVPGDYVVGGDFGRESGAAAMRKLLALKDRPTAVFASNDLMALGAWDEADKAGLSVGHDIALVGFDDITEAFTPPYSLTTVKQDYRAISVEAARMLLEKIADPERWKPRQVLVPTELIVRQSCGSKKKWN
jgi:LacI family transcriptional regulator, galactose operon repressor